MGPKLQRLDWIWMYPQWIINVVVRFVFCLALPEVIHLPRGLGAVTRNWRNHDSTELSAPQSPGEESDGARCSTKRWEHFPIWVFFFSLFFFSNIFLRNCSSLHVELTSDENLNLIKGNSTNLTHQTCKNCSLKHSKRNLNDQKKKQNSFAYVKYVYVLCCRAIYWS